MWTRLRRRSRRLRLGIYFINGKRRRPWKVTLYGPGAKRGRYVGVYSTKGNAEAALIRAARETAKKATYKLNSRRDDDESGGIMNEDLDRICCEFAGLGPNGGSPYWQQEYDCD